MDLDEFAISKFQAMDLAENTDLRRLREENKELFLSREFHKTQLAECQKKTKSLSKEVQSLKSSLEDCKTERKEQDNVILKSELMKLQAGRDEKEELKVKLSSTEYELKKASTLIDENKALKKKVIEIKLKLQKKIKKLTSEHEKQITRSQNTVSLNQLQVLEKELSKTRAKLKATKEKHKSLSEEFSTVADGIIASHKKLTDRYEKIKESKIYVTKKYQALQDENNRLSKKIKEVIQSQEASSEMDILFLKRETSNLKTELQEKDRLLTEKMNSFSMERFALEERILILEEKLGEAEQEKMKSDEKNANLIQKLKKENKAMEARKDSSSEKILELNGVNMKLENEIEEVKNKTNKKIQELMEENRKLQQKLAHGKKTKIELENVTSLKQALQELDQATRLNEKGDRQTTEGICEETKTSISAELKQPINHPAAKIENSAHDMTSMQKQNDHEIDLYSSSRNHHSQFLSDSETTESISECVTDERNFVDGSLGPDKSELFFGANDTDQTLSVPKDEADVLVPSKTLSDVVNEESPTGLPIKLSPASSFGSLHPLGTKANLFEVINRETSKLKLNNEPVLLATHNDKDNLQMTQTHQPVPSIDRPITKLSQNNMKPINDLTNTPNKESLAMQNPPARSSVLEGFAVKKPTNRLAPLETNPLPDKPNKSSKAKDKKPKKSKSKNNDKKTKSTTNANFEAKSNGTPDFLGKNATKVTAADIFNPKKDDMLIDEDEFDGDIDDILGCL